MLLLDSPLYPPQALQNKTLSSQLHPPHKPATAPRTTHHRASYNQSTRPAQHNSRHERSLLIRRAFSRHRRHHQKDQVHPGTHRVPPPQAGHDPILRIKKPPPHRPQSGPPLATPAALPDAARTPWTPASLARRSATSRSDGSAGTRSSSPRTTSPAAPPPNPAAPAGPPPHNPTTATAP